LLSECCLDDADYENKYEFKDEDENETEAEVEVEAAAGADAGGRELNWRPSQSAG